MMSQSGLDRQTILAALEGAAKELEGLQQRASDLRTFISSGRKLLGEDDHVDLPPSGAMMAEIRVNHQEATNGHDTIQEHNLGDWARRYLVEVGKPLRASEIAKGLVEHQWVTGPPPTEAIRTAMGRRPGEFERIGFGIYALKEWPRTIKRQTQRPSRLGALRRRRSIQQGLLPQLIHAVLSKQQKPLTFKEIIGFIEADGQKVNRASVIRAIYRCIKHGRLFYLVSPGVFGLLEWRNREEANSSPYARIEDISSIEGHSMVEEPQQGEFNDAESTINHQNA